MFGLRKSAWLKVRDLVDYKNLVRPKKPRDICGVKECCERLLSYRTFSLFKLKAMLNVWEREEEKEF